ncbi:MAG: NAD-binding protein [Anaerolineaceae bacterium]|nr:NAD-binding protein [Anaerolineaceae bacterium]
MRRIQQDFKIILSQIWANLILLVGLILLGAVLLRFFGGDPQAGWPQLFLDAFHLAAIERVETGGKIMPVLLAFILPIGMTLILGEGILRVFKIYMKRRENRKDWDLMVIRTYHEHTVICGVGEMGRQLVRRMVAKQPGLKLVLIDPRQSILMELALSDEHAIHFQGDMTNIETLKQANLQTAKLAILTAGDDAVNLETAYKIQEINPDLNVWVRLHHSGLSELLDLSRKPQIHFFCPYQQAADAVVEHIINHTVK